MIAPRSGGALRRAAFTLLFFGVCGCGAPREPATSRAPRSGAPDVVLVTLDTFRADRAGCMGHPGGLTPAIDALVRRGFLAREAFAPAPLTAISHASMLTGLEPPEHGVRENAMFPLSGDLLTLPGHLREHGFTTAGFVSGLPLARQFGFANGFDFFDDTLDPVRAGDPNYPERSASKVRESLRSYLDSTNDATLASKRLFLWLHFFDPHHPRRVFPALKTFPAKDDYDREIRGLDVVLGRTAADLETRRGSSHFVVATDHGEALGDHGEFSHGVLLYESTMHALFGIALADDAASADPSAFPCGPSEGVVRFADLAPTLLDALDLPPLPGASGRSILAGGAAEVAAYGESYYSMFHYGWSPLTCLRDARWTYVESPEPELFDRLADPGERISVIAAHPQVAARLRERLRAMTREPELPRANAIDDATADQLASLGYVAGSNAPPADRRKNPKKLMPAANALFRGITLQSEGRLPEALAWFQRAYRDDPDNFSVLFQLADCLRQLGDPMSAMSYYRRAVTIHPGASDAVAHLAALTFQQGGRPEAFRLLDEALQRNPENFALLMTSGDLFLEDGEPARAAALYERAAAADPQRAEPWIGLAETREAQRDREGAREAWDRAVRLDPTHPQLPAGLRRGSSE